MKYFQRMAKVRITSMAGLLLLLILGGCSNAPSPQPVSAAGEPVIPDHTPFADISCLNCHAADRPAPVIDTATGAAVIHGGGKDCGQCHTAGAASWRVFTAFSHSPAPAACFDCHSAAQPTVLVNRMLHNYPGVGDCAACHVANAGLTWRGGTYAHEPYPGSCAECHAAERPTAVVNGFSHDSGGSGDCASCHHSPGVRWSDGAFSHTPAPANCSGCHAGSRPTGLVGTPPFDHAIAGTGDCKSCHAVQSATQRDWSGGSFSHSPAPTACIDCHLGIRPVGPAGTPPFDHANGGTGDCVSCHRPKSATQTNWSGAGFSHSPTPATCNGCHVPDRPTGPVGTPSFDHAIAGTGDCKSCHAVKSATQTDWRGGTFSHNPLPTTCIDCHLAQRPVTLTSSGFDHSIGGLGDCAACHQNAGVRWTGAISGYDHGTMPATTRCDSCHAAKRPAAAVSVAWPGHPSSPNQFLHSVMPATDCKGCHLDPGGAWAGGIYSHSPNPGQCTVCHLNQRPVGPSGSPLFDHALGGSGDCVACHAVRSTNKTDWTGGTFTHTSAITACSGCHEYRRPADTLHTTQATGDCISCHAPRSVTKNDWTGASFNHVPKPTTCAGCHIAQKPSAAVRNTGLSTDGRSYQNDYLHSQVSGDCVACHAVKSASTTDWTGAAATSGTRYLHDLPCGNQTSGRADVFRSFPAWPRRLQELSRLRGTTVDRRFGDSIGRGPDAAERKKLGQYHRRSPGHRCGKGRPDLRKLPRHKCGSQNHRLRSRFPRERQQVRLLPLHRADGNLGHREDQKSREHQQYEGLHGVRLSPAEVVPHLENHKPDVYGRGVG